LENVLVKFQKFGPRYITNAKVNLAFHLSGVNKSSTGLCSWG